MLGALVGTELGRAVVGVLLGERVVGTSLGAFVGSANVGVSVVGTCVGDRVYSVRFRVQYGRGSQTPALARSSTAYIKYGRRQS